MRAQTSEMFVEQTSAKPLRDSRAAKPHEASLPSMYKSEPLHKQCSSDVRKMITVDCGANGLLSGFHFEFSEGGRWARSRYTCSKAGGAPVVMEPSTKIEQLTQASRQKTHERDGFRAMP